MIDLDAIASHASALLAAAPHGPYEAAQPDIMPGRSLVTGGTETREPFDAFAVAVTGPHRVAIAEMLAASHGLATQTLDLIAAVRERDAEIARIRAENRASAEMFVRELRGFVDDAKTYGEEARRLRARIADLEALASGPRGER